MDKLCLEITYSVLILVSLGEPVPVNSPNFPVKDLVIIAYRASLGAIFILIKPEKFKLKFLFGGSLFVVVLWGHSQYTQFLNNLL